MESNLAVEPLHLRILVPLGAAIALTAAVLAAAVIAVMINAPQDLTDAFAEVDALSVARALLTLLLEAFWWWFQ